MTKLLAFDDQSNKLFFQATKPDQPQSRHIYELRLSSNRGSSDYLKCITCELHLISRNSSNWSDVSDETNERDKNPILRSESHLDEQFIVNSFDYSMLDNLEDLSLRQHPPLNFTVQNAEINENITSLRKWINNCDNYDASFSSNFRYFVLACNGPNVPYVELWQNEPVKRRSEFFFQLNFVHI